LAKMFIDQLSMIQEKTRGNLSNEEAAVLKNSLSNLQMVYVEVARHAPKGAGRSEPPTEPKPETSTTPEQPPITTSNESESKKKFTKSYGSRVEQTRGLRRLTSKTAGTWTVLESKLMHARAKTGNGNGANIVAEAMGA